MKKRLYTLALICFAFGTMVYGQAKGAHPYKVSENKNVATVQSHWSIIPHIGFNVFDGDFNGELRHPISLPSAGLDVEYSFNPVWALGAEYMYTRYGVAGNKGHAAELLRGDMHKAGVYVSMDFMNLFYPYATRKIASLNGIVGGGYGWYKSSIVYHDDKNGTENPTHYKGNSLNYVNVNGEVGKPDWMDKYKSAVFFQFGLNVEFNINRTLALGLRGAYYYYLTDEIDGRGYAGESGVQSKNNDGVVDVTLNMRIKLDAVKKTHVRNLMIDPRAKFAGKVETQYVHDTVIIRHDSIIVREYKETTNETTTIKENETNSYYVYFDNNKDNINEAGLITIQQVADRLAEDTALYAVVTGYCDNTGSNSFNYALGDRRAANVMDELREEHGIQSSHLYAMGMGKLVGRRSQDAYGPNRRAVIRLVDKETFDRMKNDLNEKKTLRQDDNKAQEKTVPIAESARQEKTNIYAKRTHEEVITEKETTLSKLARKYYNNTHCWVYIYIANKDRISNPNALTPGTKLIIPELTKEEMQISKDQCLRLYSSARQSK